MDSEQSFGSELTKAQQRKTWGAATSDALSARYTARRAGFLSGLSKAPEQAAHVVSALLLGSPGLA